MRYHHRILGLAVTLGIAATLGVSCIVADPVQDDRIKALGPEASNIRTGPLHRAGQPCLACHGGYGPGPLFTFAGTLYATPTDATAINGAKITVIDATGRKVIVFSNCAGNFLTEGGTPLVFPLVAEVECTLPLPPGSPADTPKQTRRSVMQTRIDRDGSCSTCHTGNPSPSSPGRLSCDTTQPDPPYTSLAGCFAGGG